MSIFTNRIDRIRQALGDPNPQPIALLWCEDGSVPSELWYGSDDYRPCPDPHQVMASAAAEGRPLKVYLVDKEWTAKEI